jgi:ATP-dependent Clp protease ATP-binding subunit ClpA
MCQQQNTPFLTFHTLLALLENHDSRTRYHLDCLTPPCAAQLQRTFLRYIDEMLPREKLSFSNFRWEARSEIQEALQIAREEGFNEVTEELGVLNTQSTSKTVQLLGKLLGKDNFQELRERIRVSLKRSRSPQRGTPNINEVDVFSIYSDIFYGE